MKADLAAAPFTPTAIRSNHLDGLRGCAVLLVLAHHLLPTLLDQIPGSPQAYLGVLLAFGFVGVDLFFVLSGYFVGGIVLDQGAMSGFVRSFYVRRAARILPLGLLAVVVLMAAHHAGWYGSGQDGGPPWPPLVYGLGLTNVWIAAHGDWGFRPLSPLWSTALEIQFYAAAPLLARMPSKQTIRQLLIVLIIGSALLRPIMLMAGTPSLATAMLPFSRMDGFFAGFLIAFIVRSPSLLAWCAARSRWIDWALVVSGLASLVLIKAKARNANAIMAYYGYALVIVFFALLLLRLEACPGPSLRRPLAAAPLAWLGRRSYFIYLFQGFIVALVVGLLSGATPVLSGDWTPPRLLAGLALLFLFAELSWRGFESPFLALASGSRRAHHPSATCS